MKRILALSSLLLGSSMVMGATASETQKAVQAFNAYADKAFCSTLEAADLRPVGDGMVIGKHQDLCGHGGNSMPREVLTAMKVSPNGKGNKAYSVVEANILAKLDIWGRVESLQRDGRNLVLIMSQLGPEDARCCPSIRMQYTIEVGSWTLLQQRQLR